MMPFAIETEPDVFTLTQKVLADPELRREALAASLNALRVFRCAPNMTPRLASRVITDLER